MSEVPLPGKDPELRAAIGERVAERLGWLREAAEAVGGPGALIENVFAQPPAVRQDAPEPEWTAEQTDKVREVAHRFGYGAEQNVSSGLVEGVRIIEGGLAWKIAAEVEALKDEQAPRHIIFSGSPDRTLTKDEDAFLLDKYKVAIGSSVATEYSLAKMFARRLNNRYADSPTVLHFGYGVSLGNPFLREPTGQLINIGYSVDAQVVDLLRVDREDYYDAELDSMKFRHRPDAEGLMRFISQVLTAQGRPDMPIGLMTSNAYASRSVSAVSAGLESGREFGVAMYGRATMAKVRGLPLQADSPLNQLPGDLRVTYDNLLQLQTKLTDQDQG